MRFPHILIGILYLCLTCTVAAAELTPDEIVEKVDSVRNPEMDYTVTAKVSSYKQNQFERSGVYEVLMKGRQNTIIKTLKPDVERGRSLLMRGPDFWAFFPEVAKPLRISLQQKLTGDVANGDIARTNFSGDYSATIVQDEIIEGKNYFVLELKSKTETATYGKVIIWVEHGSYWPLKAEFYAISGKFLKTCSYENYVPLAGQKRPSRLVLTDAINKGQYSVIEYDDMTTKEIPEKFFTKEYLNKLSY